MEKEHGRETTNEKLNVMPAADTLGTKNCVIIPEGEIPSIEDIAQAATENEAYKVNEDEAGDDLYAVQFPGHQQELLEYDALLGRLRELSGNTEE